MLSFTFNSETSINATTDREENLMFIRSLGNIINDLLKYRGYIYLNQIYEYFGVEWNVEWENLYLICETSGAIKFVIARENGDGFDIDIL